MIKIRKVILKYNLYQFDEIIGVWKCLLFPRDTFWTVKENKYQIFVYHILFDVNKNNNIIVDSKEKSKIIINWW